jgi:hypothetical protein
VDYLGGVFNFAEVLPDSNTILGLARVDGTTRSKLVLNRPDVDVLGIKTSIGVAV